jgi:hypothetical protein
MGLTEDSATPHSGHTSGKQKLDIPSPKILIITPNQDQLLTASSSHDSHSGDLESPALDWARCIFSYCISPLALHTFSAQVPSSILKVEEKAKN